VSISTSVTTATNTSGASVLSGAVSGLNTSALVAAQIEAESAPKEALQAQVTKDSALLTALRTLNSSYAALAATAKADSAPNVWNVFTTTSSASSVTATTTTAATAGSVSFTVNKVAATQVDVTAPMSASTTPQAFTFVGSDGTQTEVDPVSGSIPDLVAAINSSSAGISAVAVASGTDPTTGAALYRLQLTSTAAGASGAFTANLGTKSDVAAGTATNLMTQPGAAQIQNASDASVTLWSGTVAAQTVTSKTNTFSDLLPGVTVNVTAVETNPVTLTISPDTSTITSAAANLLTTVGTLLQSVASQSAVSTSTDASGNITTSGGVFTGDGSIRDGATQLLNAIVQAVPGKSPASIGFNLNSDGTLTFDQSAFQAALAADPAGTEGYLNAIAGKVSTQAAAQSDPISGTLTTRITSLSSQVTNLNSQVATWTTQLAARQTQLESAYASMESQLAALKTQQQWLTQQFPTTTSSTNS
jgi:flagellar hook-associated protein 2